MDARTLAESGIPSEEALMEAYINGSRQAFDTLFRQLAPVVHGFFVRRFGDVSIADDLLQITFLKIHRARKTYRLGAALRPWVFTIAARVRLDELRRRTRKAEDIDTERVEQFTRSDLPGADVVKDEIEENDTAAKVRDALAELPESQRTVILLHRYEGMTFEEIGKTLGTTEGAIKLRAFRAYEQLRKRLAPLLMTDRVPQTRGKRLSISSEVDM